MIINCPNCNKKFNIDPKLIPEKGRLLQCSSCNHKWHYTISNKENEIVENVYFDKKIKNISNNNNKKISISPSLAERSTNKQKKHKNYITNKKSDIKNKIDDKNISLANILNNLIIIFITFIALILILDTFKVHISNYLPILIPVLDNLYLSIFDLTSFVKDLFN
tara:strand:+ start:140 stop:634 length:495 start_codon:yes stop_codon:yes gene_type:complete